MEIVYQRSKGLTDAEQHFCPGCTHGIMHRLVAEAIDELGIEGRTIGIAPVGCSVFAYNYFNCDMVEAAHGRAPGTARGFRAPRLQGPGRRRKAPALPSATPSFLESAPRCLIRKRPSSAPEAA